MTTNSTRARSDPVVTISSVRANDDRLAVKTRAQVELVELLAKLVLHNLDLDAANDDNERTQRQSACSEFGDATNPRQLAGRADCADWSPATSDVR